MPCVYILKNQAYQNVQPVQYETYITCGHPQLKKLNHTSIALTPRSVKLKSKSEQLIVIVLSKMLVYFTEIVKFVNVLD